MTDEVLALDRVSKVFRDRAGLVGRTREVHAVNDVSLSIKRGEAVGLVGESGSGKSTVARLMVGLLEPTRGRVLFKGDDLAGFAGRQMRNARRDLQLIFQDPVGALDPRQTAFDAVDEVLRVHGCEAGANGRRCFRRSGGERVGELLKVVGLRAEDANRYPHELSGGQCQRLGIARALALSPTAIIADEPVSQLDVSTQAQITSLLSRLRSSLGLTLVLIAHDLSVVRQVVDRVAVMFGGRIVEEAPASTLFSRPRHPFTRALLRAVPRPGRAGEIEANTPRTSEVGETVVGCPYVTRCLEREVVCSNTVPELRCVDGEHHRVRCVLG